MILTLAFETFQAAKSIVTATRLCRRTSSYKGKKGQSALLLSLFALREHEPGLNKSQLISMSI